jgi:hypothetical protein
MLVNICACACTVDMYMQCTVIQVVLKLAMFCGLLVKQIGVVWAEISFFKYKTNPLLKVTNYLHKR